MKEIFVLFELDNKYAISNFGQVKNVRTDKILNLYKNVKGYLKVQLVIQGRRQTFSVHRLVARHFIPNPDGKPYVNHKDGDKSNNLVSNLEWCTAKENDTHARQTGLKLQNKPIKAINIETLEEITFESLSECARYFNCNKSYIHRVLKNSYGRTQYKGYKFIYI